METLTDLIRFFDLLFGAQAGYLCVATAPAVNPRAGFRQIFFEWPEDIEPLYEFIIKWRDSKNIWFCVNLLDKPVRNKENCLPTHLVWTDLDAVHYNTLNIPPPIVIESSLDRYQAIWLMDDKIDPVIAEDYSKRIAYKYGADHSGWDLTQLLRMPGTINFKYDETPTVKIVHAINVRANPTLFETIPRLWDLSVDKSFEDSLPIEIPDADAVIVKYWNQLKVSPFAVIYNSEPLPTDDWSRILWKLVNLLIEAGMSEAECLAVAWNAKCNKYVRDNRPIKYLWREVLKASLLHKHINSLRGGEYQDLKIPDIVLSDTSHTFIDDYKEWAVEATDAVPQFHELSAFILLSALGSASLKLKTTYGEMIPNLWGLILGDSTLSRKTTAMGMATNFIAEISREIVLATDGSAEGLLSGLADRPNRTSIFLKDEISGFFDSLNHKDYLAGMPEMLTQLYDVPQFFTRRLRKETINVINPIFIFFGGGIREKVYANISEEYVLSGFLPRFLVVSGETDISAIRRTGPENSIGNSKRRKLLDILAQFYEAYSAYVTIKIADQEVSMSPTIEASLTDEAWNLYGEIEYRMMMAANDSVHKSIALPTFERLSRSILKMAILLAAIRQEPTDNALTVGIVDITNAASYVQNWGKYSIDMILNAGNSVVERLLARAVKMISSNPGVSRGILMQRLKLTKRDADMVLQTLEERDLVTPKREGRGTRYWALQ